MERAKMIRVLIVDDEKRERSLLRIGFDWEANGLAIIGEAGSGEEALEIAGVGKPEIVLTDINMPKMNGLQMAERLREADENCHIVIITKCREFEYARQAVRIGVEDFLLKPVDMEELGGIILRIREKVLAERQKERQQEAWREYVSKDIVRESFYQRLVEGRVEIETAATAVGVVSGRRVIERLLCCEYTAAGYGASGGSGRYGKKNTDAAAK